MAFLPLAILLMAKGTGAHKTQQYQQWQNPTPRVFKVVGLIYSEGFRRTQYSSKGLKIKNAKVKNTQEWKLTNS